MELWKDIKDYEGRYQISSYGNIRSLNYLGHGNIRKLAPMKDTKGYLRIGLYCNGKRKIFKIHRLVAQAFIDNPCNKAEVNHKDGVKTNNCVENLEWATARENSLHAYKHGLKEKTREWCKHMGLTMGREAAQKANELRKTPVIAIRLYDGVKLEFGSQADASTFTGAPQGNIWKVLNGERKSAMGYTFLYK